jgi:predicted NBD/HSP70 family sugar kinase
METAVPGNPNSVRTPTVDIGGTGVKAIALDAAGNPLTERARIATPRPATPKALLAVIVELARRRVSSSAFRSAFRVSCGTAFQKRLTTWMANGGGSRLPSGSLRHWGSRHE